jgi:hypothetical protein
MNKFKSPSPAKKSRVSNSHKKRAAENKNKREQNKAFKPKKTRRKIGYRRKAGGGACPKGSSVHVPAADFDFLRKRIKTKSRTPEEESVGIDHGRLCIYNTK